MIPVWRDTIISYDTTADYITYTIGTSSSDADVFYTGRAYRKPDSNRCEFKINKICENYLKQDLDDSGNATINVFVKIDGVTYSNLRFYFNYDYTSGIVPTGTLKLLSDPINGKISNKLVFSVLNTNSSTATVSYGSGNVTVAGNSIGNFIVDIDSDVNILGVDYKKVNECGEGQLIYLNKMGGYDVVDLSGRMEIEDEFEGYEYNRSYNNTTNEFENNKYLNVITKNYVGHIFWLNKEQAKRLDNLFGSTQVYLLKDGDMIPVVITSKNYNYNNTKKLISVDIEFKESQNKIRR